MRRLLFLLPILLLAVHPEPARAQGQAPELYLNAYMSVQQGEKLEAQGKLKAALQKYRYAASLLDQVEERDARWQPLIVDYRRRKTGEAIAKIEKRISAEGEGPAEELTSDMGFEGPLPTRDDEPPALTTRPSATSSGGDVVDQATAQIRDRIETLQRDLAEARNQVRMERAEKEDVARRLNNALDQLGKVQVTAAEATARINQLEDALKNATERSNESEVSIAAQKEIERLNSELRQARIDRDAADDQNEELFVRLSNARVGVRSLTTERNDLTKQRDQALADLDKAKQAQQKVDQLVADNAALMEKLAIAQKQVQEFNNEQPKKDEKIAALTKDLGQAKEMLATAQKQNKDFEASMTQLQDKLEEANKALADAKSSSGGGEEQKRMARENELLRGIVLRQLKDQARRDQAKKLVFQELKKLDVQSKVLNQQLAYLSEPVAKLTAEEKALFKTPQIEILDGDSSDTSISIAAPKDSGPKPKRAPLIGDALPQATPPPAEPTGTEETPALPESATASTAPGGILNATEEGLDLTTALYDAAATSSSDNAALAAESGRGGGVSGPKVPEELLPLAREAKEEFERGQYVAAEKIYEKMLAQAPNNIYVLSNLGVTRFRGGKLRLAEESFRKAIAVEPNDTFSHCTLGIVYYQQGKFDQAVDALTKALAIDPKNAVAHNYLGITASQKGWQEAALKEMETAVTLDPNYADAHFNLAVIYATGNPPMKELARKHYKQASELGAESDPALEKLLQ